MAYDLDNIRAVCTLLQGELQKGKPKPNVIALDEKRWHWSKKKFDTRDQHGVETQISNVSERCKKYSESKRDSQKKIDDLYYFSQVIMVGVWYIKDKDKDRYNRTVQLSHQINILMEFAKSFLSNSQYSEFCGAVANAQLLQEITLQQHPSKIEKLERGAINFFVEGATIVAEGASAVVGETKNFFSRGEYAQSPQVEGKKKQDPQVTNLLFSEEFKALEEYSWMLRDDTRPHGILCIGSFFDRHEKKHKAMRGFILKLRNCKTLEEMNEKFEILYTEQGRYVDPQPDGEQIPPYTRLAEGQNFTTWIFDNLELPLVKSTSIQKVEAFKNLFYQRYPQFTDPEGVVVHPRPTRNRNREMSLK